MTENDTIVAVNIDHLAAFESMLRVIPATKNVIVMTTDIWETFVIEDSLGSHGLDYRMTGGGPVSVFRDGLRVDGTWKRDGVLDQFTFWDAADGREVRRYQWDIGALGAIAFAPDGLTCAAGGEEGRIVIGGHEIAVGPLRAVSQKY